MTWYNDPKAKGLLQKASDNTWETPASGTIYLSPNQEYGMGAQVYRVAYTVESPVCNVVTALNSTALASLIDIVNSYASFYNDDDDLAQQLGTFSSSSAPGSVNTDLYFKDADKKFYYAVDASMEIKNLKVYFDYVIRPS